MSYTRKRRIYMIDKKVQGALLMRAARYWMLSIVVVGVLTMLGWIFVSPGLGVLMGLREQIPSLFGGVMVALACSLAVLPIILYDMTKLTNRFAGPMYRLKRAMQQAAAGEPVDDVIFRDDDYWQEIADAFNRLKDRLPQAEGVSAAGHTDEDEERQTLELTSVG